MRALDSSANPKVIVPLASFDEWSVILAEIKEEIALIQNNGYQQAKQKLLSETCPFGSSYIKAGVEYLERIEILYSRQGFLEDDCTPTHFFASIVEQDKFILLPNRSGEPTVGALRKPDVMKIYKFLNCKEYKLENLKSNVPAAYYYRFLWCCDSICHKNIGWVNRFSPDPRKKGESKKRGGDPHQYCRRLWDKVKSFLSKKLEKIRDISTFELDLIGMGAIEAYTIKTNSSLRTLKTDQIDLNDLWFCFLEQLPNLRPCKYLSSDDYMGTPYCSEVPIKVSSPARENTKLMTIEELYASINQKNSSIIKK